MRMIEINKEVEVEIDLDDYFDEFLEDADDDDLIKELKDRGYSVEKQALPIKKMSGELTTSKTNASYVICLI